MKPHEHSNVRPALLLTMLFAVGGCGDGAPTSATGSDSPLAPPIATAITPASVDACGDPLEVDLLADQDLDVGSVTIANDENHLYVTYATTGGWTLQATHLEVATSMDGIPINPEGLPVLGQFTFKGSHEGITRVTYTIPLSDFAAGPGDQVVVAAQADVFNESLGLEEGAWSEGPRVDPDRGWATYSSYTVQECVVILEPTETCIGHDADAIGTFADPNLEAAVREALGVEPDADLTCALLATLTSLTARNAGIEDLTGIQNLVNLEIVRLDGNIIGDLGPLSGLTSLRFLLLNRNSIAELGPLSSLTSLTHLGLSGNAISDISPLSGLTDLRIISLSSNSITDISSLSGLTKLFQLNAQANSISDVGALSELTNLQFLLLNTNSITDISPLSGLASLTFLGLANNSISDISPLSGLTDLTHLGLEVNSIADISALAGLKSLTNLALRRNEISEIGALSGLTNLTRLGLEANLITDISALEGLVNLTNVRLNANRDLADIEPLLDNTGLGTGDSVNLRVTAVPCEEVDALKAKGVTVFSDC